MSVARVITLFNVSAVGFLFVFSNLACATDNVVPPAQPQTSAHLIASIVTPKIAPLPSASTSKKIVSKPVEKPLWNELTPAQQLALSPLAPEWNKLEKLRKAKWLEIAKKFQTMKPEEQQRLHDRMREWAKLTPEQRRVARENFSRANKIDNAQKSAQWHQYQQLSEEQKKKLAARVAPKKQLANLPSATQSKQKAIMPIKPKTNSALLKPIDAYKTTQTTQPIQQPQTTIQPTISQTTTLPDLQPTEK